MVSSSNLRPTFTKDQALKIFDRIRLSQQFRHEPGDESRAVAQGSHGLEYLEQLQMAVLTSVPFENLELHYSPHKAISLDPDLLFDKIVSQGRGRGGYCMENNVFFGTLLRTLGFKVITVGARSSSVHQPGGGTGFKGWSHMINVVTCQGQRYLVDVGYGPGGPARPLLLKDGETVLNIPPSQLVRMRWAPIPENQDQDCKLWIYERQNAPEEDFVPVFCFPDGLEWLPGDFEPLNYRSSRSTAVSMTYQVICAKFILGDQAKEIVGEIVLYEKSVYRRNRGVKEELGKFETERERVAALEKHLGITLTEAEKNGIRGLVSAIAM